MKKTIRRIIAWVLVLCLTVGTFPELMLRAYADPDEDLSVEMDREPEEQEQEEEPAHEEEELNQVSDLEEVTAETPAHKSNPVQSEENSEGYPWDGMTDEEFAEWIYAEENHVFLILLASEENLDSYEALTQRIEQIEDDEQYEEIIEYLYDLLSEISYSAEEVYEQQPIFLSTGTDLESMRERAEAIVNYRWIPSRDINTWNGSTYNGKTYFPKGTTIVGVPYTLFTSEIKNTWSLCTLYRYSTLYHDNYSTTANCVSVGGKSRTGPVYGSCCADLVCEVFGGKFMNDGDIRYHNVKAIWNSEYATTTHSQKMSEIQPGDAVSDYPNHNHIVWVGEVTDRQITIYEQTPPVARKVVLDKASHTNQDGYFKYEGLIYSTITRMTPKSLEKPQNVEVNQLNMSVRVSFDRVPNAISYDIYLIQKPDRWEDVKYSQTTTGHYVEFDGVEPGDYAAFVIAKNGNVQSAQSDWKYIRAYRPAFEFTVDGNGGTVNQEPIKEYYGGQISMNQGMVSSPDSILKGWYLYRPEDDKWNTNGQGWFTEEEIAQKGYQKVLYEPNANVPVDMSVLCNNGNTGITSFVFCAVWELHTPQNVEVSQLNMSVRVSFDRVPGAACYGVYLIQEPWGWSDVKYSLDTTERFVQFDGADVGDYAVFVIAKNGVVQSEQSAWKYIRVYRPAFEFTIDGNGGAVNQQPIKEYYGGQISMNQSMVASSESVLKGWNLYRPEDDKWFASGQGWFTEAEIAQKGYAKALYEIDVSMNIDMSFLWNNGDTSISSFVFYAVWELHEPKNVKVSQLNMSILVSFDEVLGAESYDVYLRHSPWGEEDNIACGTTTTTSIQFDNIAWDYYAVFVVARRGEDQSRQSEWINIAMTKPLYEFRFNGNGGVPSIEAIALTYGEIIPLSTVSAEKAGDTLLGWSLYRPSDNKWWYYGTGWFTEAEGTKLGYSKRVFTPEENPEIKISYQWDHENKEITTFEYYAVWENGEQNNQPINIEIEQFPKKLTYLPTEELDTTGMQLKLIYEDNSSEIISEGFIVEGFVPGGEAVQTVTVKYEDFTAEFEVYVGEAKFKSAALVLSGQIGVNFYMTLDGIAQAEDSYIEFSVAGKNGETTTIPFSSGELDANGRYVFTCYVSSIQMADEITAVYHFGDREVEQKYSIQRYVEKTMASGTVKPESKVLAQAIANYGHYAQVYLSGYRGWTMGVDHAEMPAYGQPNTGVDLSSFTTTVTNRHSYITKLSRQLGLDADTTLYILLDVDGAAHPEELRITVRDEYGNPVGANVTRLADGRYQAAIPNISAHKLGMKYSIVVDDTMVIETSVLSYAAGTLNSITSSASAKQAMAALYEYYAATMAYRG